MLRWLRNTHVPKAVAVAARVRLHTHEDTSSRHTPCNPRTPLRSPLQINGIFISRNGEDDVVPEEAIHRYVPGTGGGSVGISFTAPGSW